jgi:hypothetical protein
MVIKSEIYYSYKACTKNYSKLVPSRASWRKNSFPTKDSNWLHIFDIEEGEHFFSFQIGGAGEVKVWGRLP